MRPSGCCSRCLPACGSEAWSPVVGGSAPTPPTCWQRCGSPDRLELVTERLRAALEALAAAAPTWLEGVVPAQWYDRYGQRARIGGYPRPRRHGPSSPSPSARTGSRCWRPSTPPSPRHRRGCGTSTQSRPCAWSGSSSTTATSRGCAGATTASCHPALALEASAKALAAVLGHSTCAVSSGGPLHRRNRRAGPDGHRAGRRSCPPGRAGADLHCTAAAGREPAEPAAGPLVLSGLAHQLLHRRRLGTGSRARCGAHPDPALAEFARRIMRQTSIEATKAVWRFDFHDQLGPGRAANAGAVRRRGPLGQPEHARALADGIPQASVQRFPGAGHLVVLERAEPIGRSQGPSRRSRPLAPRSRSASRPAWGWACWPR